MKAAAGTTPRRYRQTARAEASRATRDGILDATIELALAKSTGNLSLTDVAERAGVSVQTVLRHFGTREGLLDAALERGMASIAEERRAPEGDLPAAIRALVRHYERRGDAVLGLLAQESFDVRVAAITTTGKRVHREWVEHLLPPTLDAADADPILDQLVVVTDVYAWKLLRRDRGLDSDTVERRMVAMVRAVLRAASEQEGAS